LWIVRHQNQLDNLRDTDPEFFKYLESNDASLLDFDEGDEEDDDDDDEEEDEFRGDNLSGDDDDEESLDESTEQLSVLKEKKVTVATIELIQDLIKSSNAGSGSSLRKLISVFRATCMPTSVDDDSDDEDGKGLDDSSQLNSYVVNDPEVYEYAMTEILENAHKSFYQILDLSGDDLKKSQLEELSQHPKWKKSQFLVLSFFKSITHTLTSLSDSTATLKTNKDDDNVVEKKTNQSGNVGSYLLSSLEPYIPLLSPVSRLAKGVLKVLLRLWAYGPTPEDDATNVRGQAFLRIRQMVLQLPGTVSEECFRGMYLTYARAAKTFTTQSASGVIFMAQCVTELYTLDPAQAYQQAFLYIRQLALHLRTAMMKKSAEATKLVLNWQYLNCLRLWTRVLCAQPKEDELKPLAFPLVQILYGVLAAAPSAVYVPLRFHIISCMQQLAAHVQVFVPCAAKLLEVLELHELTVDKPTASTDVPPLLQYSLRFTPGLMQKPPVREVVIQQTISLLRYESEIYRFHVGLPEYLYLSCRKLKAFIKKSKIPKWRDLSRTLCNQYESYSTYVKGNRVKLGLSPMEVQGFEPLKDFYNQHHKGPSVANAADRLGKMMSKDASANMRLQTTEEIVISSQNGSGAGTSVATVSPASGELHAAAVKAKKDQKKKPKKKKVVEEPFNSKTDISNMQDTVEAMDWSDDDDEN
jgi:nucleolar complex protein 2